VMSAANQVSLLLEETARRAIVRSKPISDGEGSGVRLDERSESGFSPIGRDRP
jgi:hypothetical protein